MSKLYIDKAVIEVTFFFVKEGRSTQYQDNLANNKAHKKDYKFTSN